MRATPQYNNLEDVADKPTILTSPWSEREPSIPVTHKSGQCTVNTSEKLIKPLLINLYTFHYIFATMKKDQTKSYSKWAIRNLLKV